MGGRKSRNKGSGFERRIAAQLTVWVGTKFTRTPSSGGWAKTGDVTPKDPREMIRFPFNMEMKNTEVWDIEMLFKCTGTKRLSGCFAKWWKQCAADAAKSKRIPIVVFTRNHQPEFCIVQAQVFRKLGLNRNVSLYIRIGGHRIFLWKEFISVPYKQVLGQLGVSRK